MSKPTPPSLQIHLHTLFFLFLTFPFHATSQVNDSEQTTLLKLKQQWANPPSINHWNSSSNHCSWPEINCTNGYVTSLKLTAKNITETIPPSICDLKNLTLIELQQNFIPGPFPKVLYNCAKLRYLDVSENYFVGHIPDDIDLLSPQLYYLSLSFNNFSGDIPPAIGRLLGLQTLKLDANMFNGSIPQEIGSLSNLEILVMENNSFVPSTIPLSFTKLKKLRELWMREMNLIGEIPENIGSLTALEVLDLSINELSGNIPSGVFLLKNLSTLYLFKNRLSGSIPLSVEALNLTAIDLSANNLNGTIPDDFGKLTKLAGLSLFFNQLSGAIPASIGRLPELTDFRVFTNNLSGELPPDFGLYSKLEGFQVATNGFTGVLPKNLCAHGVLLGVVAFDNNLSGELPKSLGNCQSLLIVRIHGNRFSGEIPDGLWTLLNLTVLMISDNSFSGKLPGRVGTNLSLVEISDNQFSGEIPPEISSWETLTVFKASNNLFSGTIPQELTALPHLTTVLLDRNRLSGNFPSNLISWKSLSTLNLSGNQLSGPIPAEIGFLLVLTELDLSENEFSGQIPPAIGDLRLTWLNFSSNRFTGRIPSEFENSAFDSSFLNNPGLCASKPSLGLNICNSKTRNSSKFSSQFIVVVSSISAVLFVIAMTLTLFVVRGFQKRKIGLDSMWKLTSFQRLNFTASNISSGLTESNAIGSGGSGKVYRVPINYSGDYVAVKRIWNDKKLDQKLEKEFLAEVEVLSTIRHANIVKLMCCISSDNSKLLVYEYLENRSLDRWLHGKRRPSSVSGSVHHVVLDWPTRLQIAVGAARGLCYMHHDCSPPIVHRDVKSSNVLLDSEFNAKIADFGLARILVKHGEPNTVSSVAGSFGYIAPEYAHTSRVNEKIDVYSFGVILLELVTGKEANDGDETTSLAEWAWHHVQKSNPIEDALDKDIMEPCYLDEMSNVFKLGIICTGTFPSTRPTMKEVLQILFRCNNPMAFREKNIGREYDAAPLLNNSKRERMVEHEDDGFTSIV
ncbi:unnamed protein product [Ilex paraguariensis]|uniref:Protein kinase domain-containing protein n=1 Tax=Ilex paraguariensis TaxID=185542 RepID=A0ABC8QXU5_9AQUA